MNKFRKLLIIGVVAGLMTTSFGLLKVEGIYTNFAKGSGIGFGADFPFIPFVPTKVFISTLGEKNIVLPSLDIAGTSLSAGSVKFKPMVIEFMAKFPIDLAGVSVGGSLILDWWSIEGSQNISTIGNRYAGVLGAYKQNVMPLVEVFGQAGYLIKVFDAEKAIEDNNSGLNIDLSEVDQSGLFLRAGVSIGI